MSYPVLYVPAGDVIPILFSSYNSDGASVTLTGLAVTDVEIYKDGSVTQRASDAGYALLDTDGIDFDGITGLHGFSVDTGDNTDAGFYTVGSWFTVVVSAVTIDTQTVTFIAAMFRIMPAESSAGVPKVDLSHVNGAAQTATLDTIKTETAAILVDTGTTLQAELDGIQADTEDIQTRIGTPAGASVSADIAAVKAETAAIVNDTDIIDDATSGLVKIAADVAAILVDTAVIGAAGAGLTEAGGTGDHLTAVPWNAGWDAEVQSEVQDAIEVNHLDHLLAVDYDPATKPGTATALLNELVESDVGVSRFTANALEQAPTGGSAPTAAEIADAVWDEAQAGHVGAGTFGEIATEIAAILVDTSTTLDDVVDAILADTADMQPKIGSPVTSVSADIAAVKAETAAIVNDTDLIDDATSGLAKIATDVAAILADTGTDGVVVAAASKTGYSLTATTGLGNQTANITGSLSGSVGSVTGAVGSVTGAVGSVTGNVGGNVTGSVGSLATQAKADVNAEVDGALADYDPPTHTELVAEIDAVQADIAALENLSAAAVNAEVVDALATDTYAEPGQGAPAATTTLATKIGFLYKAWRNRSTMTDSEYALYADDATTKDQDAAVSDDDTTFERGEVGTGA